MEYRHDIFISYAHLDNQSAFQGQNGWVSDFHRALEVRVAQLLGRTLEVWRDPKLAGNDIFSDAIVQQLPTSALLITVLSPRYVKSEWCRRELMEFYQGAGGVSGIAVGTKARVFKVLKTPIPADAEMNDSSDLRALLRPLLGYEFFRVDPQTGKFHELDLAFGPEAKAEYWLRLDDLAQDVAALLGQLMSGQDAPAPIKATVYLAEGTLDVREEAAAIRRNLESHGCKVLPHHPLPLEAGELRSVLTADLRQCEISIHPVGGHYGVVPENSSHSLVELQHEIAREYATGATLTRLVWIAPNLSPEDQRQRDFIQRLKTADNWDEHSDLLEAPLETLKTAIDERLDTAGKNRKAPPTVHSIRLLHIYLIHEQEDRAKIGPLRDFLMDQGFEVLLPLFTNDEAEARLEHEDNLKIADAAIVYHGEAHEEFLRKKLRELRKSAGSIGAPLLRMTAVCMAPPDSPEKRLFRSLEVMRIDQGEAFASAPWSDFLRHLQEKGAPA